jgi:zinc transport system permease protein
MFDVIGELFSYTFILRALTVGMLVALCSALLGVSLVLKRYSMIGDGLSHVGFGALSVAMAMNLAPLQVSIPVVVGAAFLLLRISENSRIKGDAAIALIASSSIAAMSRGDVMLSILLSIIVLLLFIFFYHKIFAVTFDENFAKATGTKVGIYNMMIALLTAVTIVVGMRIMGSLLISSLIIFPALSSMRIFRSFRSVIITSGFISMFCFFWGIAASYTFDTPAGASIVMIDLLAFGICCLIGLIPRAER